MHAVHVRWLCSTWLEAQARACAGTTGLPQRAKKPVTSECHNRSQITDHRSQEHVEGTVQVIVIIVVTRKARAA